MYVIMGALTPLEEAYPGWSLWKPFWWLNGSKTTTQQKVVFPATSKSTSLTQQLKHFTLTCLPLTSKIRTGWVAIDSILNQRCLRSVASMALYSANHASYSLKSSRDIERTRKLIRRIATHAPYRWSLEIRAFLIHQLMAYVVAYRSDVYFENGGSRQPFYLLTHLSRLTLRSRIWIKNGFFPGQPF